MWAGLSVKNRTLALHCSASERQYSGRSHGSAGSGALQTVALATAGVISTKSPSRPEMASQSSVDVEQKGRGQLEQLLAPCAG